MYVAGRVNNDASKYTVLTQLTFTCSKPKKEALEKGV